MYSSPVYRILVAAYEARPPSNNSLNVAEFPLTVTRQFFQVKLPLLSRMIFCPE